MQEIRGDSHTINAIGISHYDWPRYVPLDLEFEFRRSLDGILAFSEAKGLADRLAAVLPPWTHVEVTFHPFRIPEVDWDDPRLQLRIVYRTEPRDPDEARRRSAV